jgi:hypothetical protein
MHQSRLKEDVIALLKSLPHPERIIGIAIDTWDGYRTAIETALPHVMIVIDAFHVIQASTRALDQVRKDVQKTLTKDQRKALKQDKELLAEPKDDLTPEQQERVKQWEKEIPELAQAIRLHQKLRSLYHCQDFEEMMYLTEEPVVLSGEKFENEIGPVPNTSYQDGIRKTMEFMLGKLRSDEISTETRIIGRN